MVNEVFGLRITQDSARANLIAGGDLNFVGGSFDNRFSTVSAGGDIDLDTVSFRNTGAAGGETRYYDYYVYTKSRPDYYGLLTNIDRYNAYHDPASASYDPSAMPLASYRDWETQVSDQLEQHFGDKVFRTVIPRNVRLAEAPSYGMPGVVFDPSSKGAQAYIAFGAEMVERIKKLDN